MGSTTSDLRVAAKTIADLRVRLLDLRNSNKLLSYKHSERGKTQVRVVDEQPDFLHECLISGKKLAFRSLPAPKTDLPDEFTDEFLMALEVARQEDVAWHTLLETEEDTTSDRVQKLDRQIRDIVRERLGLPPARNNKTFSVADWARLNGVDPSFELPLPNKGTTPEKHTDSEIQTLLLPDELQGRMAGVRDQARTAQQDMGVNLLHMAIGFLEWFESPTSEKAMLAPLLLYPADLDRFPSKAAGQYRYILSADQDPTINITLRQRLASDYILSADQDPTINITLRQRLASDYNLIVPEFEENDTPEAYMERMAFTIKELPRWRIRRFATLGLFSFSRLAMYNDLEPQRWGEADAIASAGALGELFGRKESGNSVLEAYDLDAPDVSNEVPVLIRDADSSQHQAIIDVMRGKHLVIQGPPGTGKSQTIANIIAACLAKQKTVLFVAEKGAALEVVKKRLDGAGLGEFCLELHSTKANKGEVLKSLDCRLKFKSTPPEGGLNRAQSDLSQAKGILSDHAKTISAPFSALEVLVMGELRQATVYDILWGEQRTRGIPLPFSGLERIRLTDATETSLTDKIRRIQRLSEIENFTSRIVSSYGALANHPWSFVRNHSLQFLDVSEIIDLTSTAADELERLSALSETAGEFLGGVKLPDTVQDLANFSQLLVAIPIADASLPDHLLRKALIDRGLRDSLNELVDLSHKWRHLSAEQAVLLFPTTEWNDSNNPILQEFVNRSLTAGFVDMQLSEVASRSKSLGEEVPKWAYLMSFADRALQFFGLAGTQVTAGSLKQVFRALELLPSLERKTLLARSPSILDENVAVVLSQAAAKATNLYGKHAVLLQQVEWDSELSVLEIRRYVKVLRSTGIFGRFFSEYRTVKKECLSRLKTSEIKGDQQIARVFLNLANYLEERHAFENDPILKSIFGHRFKGLQTDIDSLIDANQFAARIRSTFAGLGEVERGIRKFFLEAEMDSIDALGLLLADPGFDQLRVIANAIPESERATQLFFCKFNRGGEVGQAARN